jgi:hypothetical protein
MEGDPYSVLGLPWGASADSIREAFRRLAFRLHPDRNPGDSRAEAQFKLVSAAYQRLKAAGWSLPRPKPQPTPRAGNAKAKSSGAASDVRPQYWPDGAPIHYPTQEEIDALLRDIGRRTLFQRVRGMDLWAVKAVIRLYFLLLVAALAFAVVGLVVVLIEHVFQCVENW